MKLMQLFKIKWDLFHVLSIIKYIPHQLYPWDRTSSKADESGVKVFIEKLRSSKVNIKISLKGNKTGYGIHQLLKPVYA